MRLLILFLFLGAPALAQSPLLSIAPNPIEQAQEKALQKHRQEACVILNQAIEAAKSQPKQRTKLIEFLDSVSTQFFTDKAQRLYQSAQSVLFDTPDLAITRLKEALEGEDENVLVNLALARAYLFKGDYSSAEKVLSKAKELHPAHWDASVLQLTLLTAQKKFEVVRESLRVLSPPVDKSQEIYVKQIVAQDFMDQEMTAKAVETLTKATELDANYPEAYYFLTRAAQALGTPNEEWARKYVSLCKGLDAKVRRKYANEPALCSRLKEVEDELSKKPADT